MYRIYSNFKIIHAITLSCSLLDLSCNDDDDDDDELSTELIIVISVVGTFIVTLVITAVITYIITSLCHRHRYQYKLKKIAADDGNNKNGNIKKLPRDDNAYEDVSTIKVTSMDTEQTYEATSEPAYETTFAVKTDTDNIIMDSNPAYALSNF